MKPEPVEAEYQPAALAAYQGNPFIEALPSVSDEKELSRLLARGPVYDAEDRCGPASLRREALINLQSLFIPLPCHFDLAWTLIRSMRRGYLNRNPASDKYLAGIRKSRVKLTSQMKTWNNAAEPAPGFSIIGASGIGKSSAINAVLNLFPQVIEHREYQGKPLLTKQVTWIKLDLPFDASVKGLVAKFLAKADALLETEFHKMVLNSRSTVDMLMPDMATAAAMCGLGLLVIDEVQHLQAAKSGGAAKMLNFFVELSNTMGVPVALVGTPQALEPLSSEFRSARRACGQGSLYWDRMKENDPVFGHLLKKIWKYQYTAEETPLTDEIASCMYHETQGITHLIVTLYLLAQDRVIGTGGGEKITPSVIQAAARQHFRPIAPFLDGLIRGRSNASMGDMGFQLDFDRLREGLPSITISPEVGPKQGENGTSPMGNGHSPNEPTEIVAPKKRRGRKPKGGFFGEAVEAGKDPHTLLKERGIARSLDDLLDGKEEN